MNFPAAAGDIAPTVIRTDAQGLVQGDVRLPVANDETLEAYYAAPQGRHDLPIVLVVQEIFGVHEHIKDICRRLAKAGYLAVAANLYQRQGDASTYTEISKLIAEIVSQVPDEQVFADLDACVAWAARHGGDPMRVAVTGFCWGGRLTWMYAAHNPRVKAGVAWYGKLGTGHGPLIKRYAFDVVDDLYAPVLGLYGAKDASIPMSDIEIMQTKLAGGNENARRSAFVVYPQADHAFMADYRRSYQAEAAKDGWARMLEWFKRYL